MINEQDKQRIERDADSFASEIICDGEEIFLNKVEYKAYIAGATAELERSEKLLQEYREVIRELLPYAEYEHVQIVKYWGIESFAAATLLKKINRAKNLIEPKTDKA